MSYNRNYHKSYSSYDNYGQGNYRNNNNYQRNNNNYNSNYQRDYYEYNNNYQRNNNNYNSNYQRDYYEYNNNYQRNNYYNEPYQNNNSYYNQNYSRGGYRGFATEDNRQNFDNYYLNKKKNFDNYNQNQNQQKYKKYESYQNPTKEEIKEEDIKSEIDENEIQSYNKKINETISIEKLREYCESKENKDNIKLVAKNCPINTYIQLIDLSIAIKGPEEEKAYLDHPEYTSLIRRGNTILEKYDINNNYEYSILLRKGMKKFIDIPFKFYLERKNKTEEKKYKLNMTNEYFSTLQYIFYPVLESIEDGYLIEIIKLMKANGENAQISYSKKFNFWVIASKNVCLCAKNRNDLESYNPRTRDGNPTRYSFAYVIGHCWFDIIDNFSNEEIENLKNYLDNKTFVGEYVGNQYHQHLIRYMKHTILFFGIVKNESNESSIPVIEAFKIFKKFKLDVVPYEYICTCETFDELCEKLKNLYIRIAESSIIDEEEGSVIYLSRTRARYQNSDIKFRDSDKVLSLCKLKTWEYRVYRKLREKIKNNLLDKNFNEESRRKISQFFEELRLMLQGFNLPMPLEFYYKVAETAFEFANFYKDKFKDDNNPYGELDLHGSYIDFLETIHSIVDDTVTLKSRIIQQNNILTYDYLIKNTLKKKKIVEIIIYAPPCYLSEEFLKNLANKYKIQIMNTFLDQNSYGNIESDIIIYHINMHNFRNINQLGKNQFIFVFGMNSAEIDKSKEKFKENMKNPLFISYNTNKSLLPFIKCENNTEKLDDLFSYYTRESIKYTLNLKKKFDTQLKIYEKFEEDKKSEYEKEIDETINKIKEELKEIKAEDIKNETFLVDNGNLIQFESNTNEKNKLKASKYKNSPYIDLYEEHKNPYEPLKEKFLNYERQKIQNQQMKVELSTKTSSNIKRIIILIPMTIPGNGKTYFINQLKPMIEKYGIYFISISSDDIRRKVMDDMMKKNYRMTENEAFEKSGRTANFLFEKQLAEQFKYIYYNNRITDAMIYIDKNHPPNAINRSTEPIKKFLKDNYNSRFQLDLQYVALIPDCINYFEFSNEITAYIPFSLSYFIQCYLRVKHRNDHPTLNGDTKNLINIFGTFIKNFINVSLKENSIMMFQKLDKAIQLPFTDEMDDSLLPEELVKAAKNFFFNIMNDHYSKIISSPSSEYFEKCINSFYPKGNEFFGTKNLVSSTAEPIITKLFNMNMKNDLYGKVTNFIYLGILFKGEDNFVKIRTKISKGLKSIKENLKIENEEIDDLIYLIRIVKGFNLPSNWKFPHKEHINLWHCTLLFKGNKNLNEIKNEKAYIQFKESEIVKVKLIGIIYIPNKTIVMIIKIQNGIVSINKYPHVTSFINQYAPKTSNEVLEKVLLNKDALDKYNSIINGNNDINTDNDFIQKYNLTINKEDVVAYLNLFGKDVDIEGVMHAFE